MSSFLDITKLPQQPPLQGSCSNVNKPIGSLFSGLTELTDTKEHIKGLPLYTAVAKAIIPTYRRTRYSGKFGSVQILYILHDTLLYKITKYKIMLNKVCIQNV